MICAYLVDRPVCLVGDSEKRLEDLAGPLPLPEDVRVHLDSVGLVEAPELVFEPIPHAHGLGQRREPRERGQDAQGHVRVVVRDVDHQGLTWASSTGLSSPGTARPPFSAS